MSKEYFHPSVTADAVIKRIDEKTNRMQVLLITRSAESKAFPNALALPGGFMDADDETIADCCAREVKEETGLDAKRLVVVGTWTRKGRDPRGPVHSTVFSVYVSNANDAIAGDDASSLEWFSVERVIQTAADTTIELVGSTSGRAFKIVSEFRDAAYGMCNVVVASGGENFAFDHAEMIASAILCETMIAR